MQSSLDVEKTLEVGPGRRDSGGLSQRFSGWKIMETDIN